MESTLGEIQNMQTTLASIMEKIQIHVMQDADKDKTTNVGKTPPISEPLHPPAGTFREVLLTSFGMSRATSETTPILAGPSRQIGIFNQPSGSTFRENLEEQLQ